MLATAPAAALAAPAPGSFRSVLAQGEGQSINALELGGFLTVGSVPGRFTDQQPLYVDIMPRAQTLRPNELDVFYKRTDFGAMPGGVGGVTRPRSGVEIVRDARFGMAHITGATSYDVMYGAGYATAQERLFLMEALRRTAKGTLSGMLGAGAASDDAAQLTDQDFSDAELTRQADQLTAKYGPDGARARADIQAYVDGINGRIRDVSLNPLALPAEYAAVGIMPAPWTIADTAAMAVLLVTQFTVSNGSEEVSSLMRQAFRQRFGNRWRAPYGDLRTAQDPEAFTVAKTPFRSDDPGRVRNGPNVIPDYGSIRRRNTIVQGPGAEERSAARAALPEWIRSLIGLKRSLPHHASNAVMVPGAYSRTGRPLAAMGPQVSYYSPQIFVEYELHGGGIDTSGVSFPGASPYPLIGHGKDFAWSGTSANGDNQDTFVERLCNPSGSAPTQRSTHYLYRGRCIPFVSRDQSVRTPFSIADPSAVPQTITYRTLRSVHGPVFAYATVRGAPVALSKAKAVDFHELEAVLPFMRLAENAPTDARSFARIMSDFPGSENWFYVDDREVAFIQSGRYPAHARGSDVDLPFDGDGSGDWQRFNPDTYTFRSISPKRRPRTIAPRRGFIVSWNNKEARGWRKGPTEWNDGPVHHAQLLERRLRDQIANGGGKTDLTGLTRAVNLAATADLRGDVVYPVLRAVLGRAPAADEAHLRRLDAWHRSGAKRLDENGDNHYEHSAAVALMDAWWPRLVRGAFEPALGRSLFDLVESRVLGLDAPFSWDWATQVQKDLRTILGRRVPGRFSRAYCGGPRATPLSRSRRRAVRRRCRGVLLTSLRDAVQATTRRMGTADVARWRVPATCPDTNPPECDQIVPTTAGAIETPKFPWQNRGTFHQINEILGRR